MPTSLIHWIGPFVPVVLMLSIVIANHVVTGQRNDRKMTAESSRFSAALVAELCAMLELYKTNLALIEQRTSYILSTRSSIVVYKGNLGRLTMLLDEPAIGHVVAVFAQNERVEAIIAAHSNLKCNLTYQFPPAEAKFDEWKSLYQDASQRAVAACRALQGNAGTPKAVSTRFWRAAVDQFFLPARQPREQRWSVG